MKTLVCVGLCLLFVGSAAIADDFAPPPWHGEWSTTFQWWDFGYDPLPGAPLADPRRYDPDGPSPLDQGQGIPGVPYAAQGGSPGYLPSTHLFVYPFGDWIDFDQESGRQGIWPLSGTIEVLVDNHEPPNPYKWVWVQLTWREQAGGNPVGDPKDLITYRDAGGPDGPYTHDPIQVTSDVLLADGWHHTLYEWYIRPNPVDELFMIEGDIDVDQLVVDTWCIPEPATIGLIGLGGLLLRRRKH